MADYVEVTYYDQVRGEMITEMMETTASKIRRQNERDWQLMCQMYGGPKKALEMLRKSNDLAIQTLNERLEDMDDD